MHNLEGIDGAETRVRPGDRVTVTRGFARMFAAAAWIQLLMRPRLEPAGSEGHRSHSDVS
jgi:hypothetical protein